MDVMYFDTIIPAKTPNLIANDILYYMMKVMGTLEGD